MQPNRVRSCYKLGVKFGKINILQKILEGDKSGIYFKVVKEGKIGTDDSINLIKKDNNNAVTIENIVELVTEYKDNKFTYGKSSLRFPKCWKHYSLEKLSQLNK